MRTARSHTSKANIRARLAGSHALYASTVIKSFFLWPVALTHLGHAATEDNIAQGQYALDIMRGVMLLHEKVFDLEYPLPKLDILVVRYASTCSIGLLSDTHCSVQRL